MIDETPVDGCVHCGVGEREHGTRHTVAAGWHAWVAPDEKLLRQRMWYRRFVRATKRNLITKEN